MMLGVTHHVGDFGTKGQIGTASNYSRRMRCFVRGSPSIVLHTSTNHWTFVVDVAWLPVAVRLNQVRLNCVGRETNWGGGRHSRSVPLDRIVRRQVRP